MSYEKTLHPGKLSRRIRKNNNPKAILENEKPSKILSFLGLVSPIFALLPRKRPIKSHRLYSKKQQIKDPV